uniref:Transcription initiation factor IIA subunit 2 n=1 Tax=Centropages dorsispinatus TaxID=1239308 RepID=A0A0U2VDD4_9MAXI|nr:transcription initiation factor IIA subunit 2 [Centropages dorsispinatus]
MSHTFYQGTRIGQALKEALEEMEEYEQISPSAKRMIIRKFDDVICDTLENKVDQSLILRADRLWSFRFCDSAWQLLLKNVEFLTNSGNLVASVNGKVKIVACDARKSDRR